ncbi:hypothetical protein F2Q68_00044396 [Brassica cretica]|uniref:FAD/NAD(P)-binding domain-containing protein n=1 Tax=Brassica cretica TaxID=69181 RepID=A0A8S9LRB2_BRACR|nr:hypothetical protein F2Q68_00044396 [Brassica cretica]
MQGLRFCNDLWVRGSGARQSFAANLQKRNLLANVQKASTGTTPYFIFPGKFTDQASKEFIGYCMFSVALFVHLVLKVVALMVFVVWGNDFTPFGVRRKRGLLYRINHKNYLKNGRVLLVTTTCSPKPDKKISHSTKQKIRSSKSVLIVGGGPSGVELAAEIAVQLQTETKHTGLQEERLYTQVVISSVL